MSVAIKNYIINIIAGRIYISGLYDAIIMARKICAVGGSYRYTFTIPHIGTKSYNGCELIRLDESCTTLEELLTKDVVSIDDYALILIYGRREFRNLYNSYYKAMDAITESKILCYTFTNPYANFINLNKNNIQLNPQQIIELFKEAGITIFDPLLVIS